MSKGTAPASSRRALITGATSGIGAATAMQLAEEGHALWLTYAHSATAANGVAESCRKLGAPEVFVSQLALENPSSIDALVREVSTTWDSLHVLVTNGGVPSYTSLDDLDVAEWDYVMNVNARGTFFVVRGFLPLLRGGSDGFVDRSIITVSSTAGQAGSVGNGLNYSASKAAVLAMTKSFASHLAPEGIRVNSVAPGPVVSPMGDMLQGAGRTALEARIPLGGAFGKPEDVAWVIAALASPKAAFTTGATYDVNGGTRMN